VRWLRASATRLPSPPNRGPMAPPTGIRRLPHTSRTPRRSCAGWAPTTSDIYQLHFDDPYTSLRNAGDRLDAEFHRRASPRHRVSELSGLPAGPAAGPHRDAAPQPDRVGPPRYNFCPGRSTELLPLAAERLADSVRPARSGLLSGNYRRYDQADRRPVSPRKSFSKIAAYTPTLLAYQASTPSIS